MNKKGMSTWIWILIILIIVGIGIGLFFLTGYSYSDSLSNSGSSTIPEGAIVCTESDGGKDYYTKGTSNYPHGALGVDTDSCTIRSPESTEQMPVEGCQEGDDCHVIEFFCTPEGERLDFEIQNCPNGCQDGACLQ